MSGPQLGPVGIIHLLSYKNKTCKLQGNNWSDQKLDMMPIQAVGIFLLVSLLLIRLLNCIFIVFIVVTLPSPGMFNIRSVNSYGER